MTNVQEKKFLMSLWKIAWRSIQQRGLASVLTALSMGLGVMLVVLVLAIHGVVAESFGTWNLGYNMIVGAKGGSLQLTLNSVYYLSKPVENIPYDYYLEFVGAEERGRALQHSIRSHVHDAQWDAIAATMSAAPGDGLGGLAGALAADTFRSHDFSELDLERAGKFGQFTTLAIPLCLGDYYGQFRVVGTTPDLFGKLTYGPSADKSYEFAAGRNFKHWDEEHSYFEAVVGSMVAREKKLSVGDEIASTHGDPEGEGHGQKFTIVGILRPSGTPNDRAVFINMEGFFLMEDHALDPPQDEEDEASEENAGGFAGMAGGFEESEPEDHAEEHSGGEQEPLPVEQRQVTAILLRTANPMLAVGLPKTIARDTQAQAQCVMPIREINGLFVFIVQPIQQALLGITAVVCLVSGISILVSIYNSMSDRKHEIAVMRALGASRGTVMTVILFESVLLSVGGGALGWLSAHTLMALPVVSNQVEAQTGVPIGFFSFAPPIESLLEYRVIGPIIGNVPPEVMLIPALIALAIAVGFLPAMAAYRTDVAKSLGS